MASPWFYVQKAAELGISVLSKVSHNNRMDALIDEAKRFNRTFEQVAGNILYTPQEVPLSLPLQQGNVYQHIVTSQELIGRPIMSSSVVQVPTTSFKYDPSGYLVDIQPASVLQQHQGYAGMVPFVFEDNQSKQFYVGWQTPQTLEHLIVSSQYVSKEEPIIISPSQPKQVTRREVLRQYEKVIGAVNIFLSKIGKERSDFAHSFFSIQEEYFRLLEVINESNNKSIRDVASLSFAIYQEKVQGPHLTKKSDKILGDKVLEEQETLLELINKLKD